MAVTQKGASAQIHEPTHAISHVGPMAAKAIIAPTSSQLHASAANWSSCARLGATALTARICDS